MSENRKHFTGCPFLDYQDLIAKGHQEEANSSANGKSFAHSNTLTVTGLFGACMITLTNVQNYCR